MSKPLKILFVTTDLSPFCKAGGLGDVSRSLPKALSKIGYDVRIIMPRHGVIDEERYNIKLVKDNLKVKISKNTEINFRIKKGNLTKELPVCFIDKYKYFGGRNKIYEYKDENQRFMFFNFAVFEAVRNMNGWVPDIIHCNDWHNGLIPYLLKTKFRREEIFKKTRTLFTIHNLTFQFGKNWWEIGKKEQDDGVSELPDFKDKYKIESLQRQLNPLLNLGLQNKEISLLMEIINKKNTLCSYSKWGGEKRLETQLNEYMHELSEFKGQINSKFYFAVNTLNKEIKKYGEEIAHGEKTGRIKGADVRLNYIIENPLAMIKYRYKLLGYQKGLERANNLIDKINFFIKN